MPRSDHKRDVRFARLAGLAALALAACAAADEDKRPAPPPPERNYQLQLGLDFVAPWSLEEPFLNLAKSMNENWRALNTDGEVLDAPGSRAGGFVSAETGLPVRLPETATTYMGLSVLSGMDKFPAYYAGKYTLEWDGEAHGFIWGQTRHLQTRVGANMVRFYAPIDDKSYRQLRFTMIHGEGVTGLRLFRDENRKLLEAGEIWNPDFLNYAKRYDIIRTMNMQAINSSPVRAFADIARPEDPFYGNKFTVEWPAPRRYGAPYEVLFDLGVKSGAALWLNIPPMIGAPLHPADPALRREDKPDRLDEDKIEAMARNGAEAILASAEWENFAREFVDRLAASGYPADRPLYLELGNEIWNSRSPFAVHTRYAEGLGLAFNRNWTMREGYVILSARWAAALEKELAARGLSYDIVYVLASQTAWTERTTRSINGYKYQLEKLGADADRILARTGVALTTYNECSKRFGKRAFGDIGDEALRAAWERAIAEDAEGLKKRLHDYCVSGPAGDYATLPWIVNTWRAHRKIAEKEGLRVIGAYEGGSHDIPPGALMESDRFRAWWREYHWGPYGADVVRQINRAVADAFPGVILSNYVSMGEIGEAPWYDGHYAEETDMLRMWDEFARPQ